SKPTCSFILQDGLGRAKGWKVPTVLDNLIHKKEAPVQIGIFVHHGVVKPDGENSQTRFNRSFEYDGLGDRYASFLLDEIIPEVAKKYNLSDDPNDRAIGGASSGAICAFNAAWERPDAFRRVLSTIGTYVGLRGGDEFPTLIRKSEPKPIRVFLQDGSSDLDIYAGGWWTANQSMLAALKWADYDVKHAWGTGGHNGKHAAAIMPDAIRWLWRDYPEPIKARYGTKRRTNVMIEGEDWHEVAGPFEKTRGIASDKDGNVFVAEYKQRKIYRIDAATMQVTVFADNVAKVQGMDFDPDGNLLVCQGDKLTRFNGSGESETVVADLPCNDVVALTGGGIVADRNGNRLLRFTNDGKWNQSDTFTKPSGLTKTPDDAFLIASSRRDRFYHSHTITTDGLLNKQQYGYVHIPPRSNLSGASGMTVSAEGRVYMATPLGIQVFDQLGRVNLILHSPDRELRLIDVCFGGPNRDHLFVAADSKVFHRRLKAKGVGPHETVKPRRPGL
ncbi:MAG: alpha/beta hydrolase-fold protein, partial [Planctomycetota bacterium]